MLRLTYKINLGLQPTIASRAPHLLLEQSIMVNWWFKEDFKNIQRIVDATYVARQLKFNCCDAYNWQIISAAYFDQSPSRAARAATECKWLKSFFSCHAAARAACVSTWLGESAANMNMTNGLLYYRSSAVPFVLAFAMNYKAQKILNKARMIDDAMPSNHQNYGLTYNHLPCCKYCLTLLYIWFCYCFWQWSGMYSGMSCSWSYWMYIVSSFAGSVSHRGLVGVYRISIPPKIGNSYSQLVRG